MDLTDPCCRDCAVCSKVLLSYRCGYSRTRSYIQTSVAPRFSHLIIFLGKFYIIPKHNARHEQMKKFILVNICREQSPYAVDLLGLIKA